MEEKNQNIEESNKKDLTQEEIEDVQGGFNKRVRVAVYPEAKIDELEES